MEADMTRTAAQQEFDRDLDFEWEYPEEDMGPFVDDSDLEWQCTVFLEQLDAPLHMIRSTGVK